MFESYGDYRENLFQILSVVNILSLISSARGVGEHVYELMLMYMNEYGIHVYQTLLACVSSEVCIVGANIVWNDLVWIDVNVYGLMLYTCVPDAACVRQPWSFDCWRWCCQGGWYVLSHTCRALLQKCRALLLKCRALLRKCRALLRKCRVLLRNNRASLWNYRALILLPRRLVRRVTYTYTGLFFSNTGLFCGNLWLCLWKCRGSVVDL